MPLMLKCRRYWQALVEDIKAESLTDWLIMALAVAGAHLTSGPVGDSFGRGLGFFVWIFSNGALGYYFRHKPVLLLMYLIYEGYNIRGVWNNW